MSVLPRLFPALALTACAGVPAEIDEADLPSVAGQVTCERLRECDRGNYEANFFNHADCVRSVEQDYRLYMAAADDAKCDYDSQAASSAMADIQEMSCEDFYEGKPLEAQEDIWTGCPL